MRKILFTFIFALGARLIAMGQTADVQLIHNCAVAAASVVDVYANGVELVPNFAFRTATPFVSVPAGVNITIQIVPDGGMLSDAVFTTTVSFTANEKYVIVADGIVGPGYTPSPAFGLSVYAGAQLTASAGNTKVLVHHGSTDAPAVDVSEIGIGAGLLINDFTYGQFAGYLDLTTLDYTLGIAPASGSPVIRAYDAPLSTLGLGGTAITVVASGFLNPANNSNGPEFGLYVALPSGGALVALPQPQATAQIIHNCADAAASTVDIYLNGALAVDNFAFRTATPFISLPALRQITVGIAPSSSSSAADAIATFDYNLTRDEKYVIIADGIVQSALYNPAPAFNLSVFPGALETSPAGTASLLVHHGSTDAPVVDVQEIGIGAGTLINDFAYGTFGGYLELPASDYTIGIADASGSPVVRAFDAPLSTLGLGGSAMVVVASGFLDPSQNNNGSSFGLWVALPAGGPMIELPQPTTQIQIIHNSADDAAAFVDIYLDGALVADNFAFRTATPFIDVPASRIISVAVAPATSNSVADAIATFQYTLDRTEKYIIVADGVVQTSLYTPGTPFDLSVYPGAQTSAGANEVKVLVHHGATDAPTVDVLEVSGTPTNLVNDLAYSAFAGYLSLPLADYIIGLAPAAGTPVIKAYLAPLAALNLGGNALTVVASGFLNPAQNNNGAPFGLFVAPSTGGQLIPLPEPTADVQVIHNCADLAAAQVDVYLNGNLLLDNFAFRAATPFVPVPSNREISIQIAPSSSQSASEAIATFPYTLGHNENYIIVASGIVSTSGYAPSIPFDLKVFAGARQTATTNGNTDVLVFHGSTDAPTVDVKETAVLNTTAVDNISYGEFAGYLGLPTNNYDLTVQDATGTVDVACFAAPLQTLGLQGAAITVLASGFLNPAVNSAGPAFKLIAVTAGGTVVELGPCQISVEETSSLGKVMLYPNPANENIFIRGELSTSEPVFVKIVDINGRTVLNTNYGVQSGAINQTISVSNLASGFYTMQIQQGQLTEAIRFSVFK